MGKAEEVHVLQEQAGWPGGRGGMFVWWCGEPQHKQYVCGGCGAIAAWQAPKEVSVNW